MKYSRYAIPSSNLAPGATITVQTGTEDAEYPATCLSDINPAKPAMIEETDGAWLVDLGAATRVDAVAFIHHNFERGATTLRLQGNTVDAWVAPPVDEEVDVPDDDADNFSVNPWIDLAALFPDLGDRTLRYLRIVVENNPDAIALCELPIVGELLTFESRLMPGMNDGEEQPLLEHRTDHGVSTVYHFGGKWRHWTGELNLKTAAAEAAYKRLWQDARGRARPWLFVPDHDANDAWFVRFDSTRYSPSRMTSKLRRLQVGIEELSRGLYL